MSTQRRGGNGGLEGGRSGGERCGGGGLGGGGLMGRDGGGGATRVVKVALKPVYSTEASDCSCTYITLDVEVTTVSDGSARPLRTQNSPMVLVEGGTNSAE